jgi:hypothetical protein
MGVRLVAGIATAITWPVLMVAVITMAGFVWLAVTRRADWGVRSHRDGLDRDLRARALGARSRVLRALRIALAPPAAMFAGRGLVAAGTWLANTVRQRRFAGVFVTAATVVIAVPLSVSVFATRRVLMDRERTARHLRRKWLDAVCRCRHASRTIIFVRASSVSGRLADVGRHAPWLLDFDPDIVIVNSVTAQRRWARTGIAMPPVPVGKKLWVCAPYVT